MPRQGVQLGAEVVDGPALGNPDVVGEGGLEDGAVPLPARPQREQVQVAALELVAQRVDEAAVAVIVAARVAQLEDQFSGFRGRDDVDRQNDGKRSGEREGHPFHGIGPYRNSQRRGPDRVAGPPGRTGN